jgi:peptidoglycan hydrolase FlgJ
MFTSVQVEAPFGGGHAEEMWRSLQVDEYGKMIARTGGIGVADAVFKEMLKIQEAS